MRTFSIRLEEELYQKLEGARGEKTKPEFIREVLMKHLERTSEEPSDEIEYLRSENAKLLELLAREQAVSLQVQKLITESKEEITKKAWWQFWKK